MHPLIAISYRGAPGREAHVAGYVVAVPGPREIFNRRIGAGGGSFSAHLTPSLETHTHTHGSGRYRKMQVKIASAARDPMMDWLRASSLGRRASDPKPTARRDQGPADVARNVPLGLGPPPPCVCRFPSLVPTIFPGNGVAWQINHTAEGNIFDLLNSNEASRKL